MSGGHTHTHISVHIDSNTQHKHVHIEPPGMPLSMAGEGGGGNWHVGGLSAIAPRQLHLRPTWCSVCTVASFSFSSLPPLPPSLAQRSALKSVCWCSHCLVLGSRDGTTPACRPRCLIWYSLFPAAQSPLFPVPSFLTPSCVAGAAHSPRSSDTMTPLVGREERAMNERDAHRFR